MSCSQPWTQEYVSSAISVNFLANDYRGHLANALFQEQQKLLPTTMSFVKLSKDIDEHEAEIERIKEMKQKLKNDIAMLNGQIENERFKISLINKKILGDSVDPDNNPAFLRPCAKCNGFLVAKCLEDNVMTCGNCCHTACLKCFKDIDNEGVHECDVGEVESVRTMMANSKPCPGCHILIQKSEGCSQMWHDYCNTTFDYITGQIDYGYNHNPIYHEFLRNNPNLAMGVMGECVTFDGIRNAVNNLPGTDSVFHTYDMLLEAQHEIIPAVEAELKKLDDKERMGRDLRIKFIRNQITQEYFENELYKRNRVRERLTMKRDIMRTFVDVGSDFLGQFIHHASMGNYNTVEEVFSGIRTLRVYTNDCLVNMAKMYKGKVEQITQGWTFEQKN